MVRRSSLCAVLCATFVSFASSASAQVFRVGDAFPLGGTAQIDFVDVAYDSANARYFKVNEGAGHTRIEGQLIDPTRDPSSRVVANVIVNDGGDNNQFPRVSYSPHVGTAGGYLVTWHKQDTATTMAVVGRLINHNGDPVGGEFTIATTPSNWLQNAASAYTTGSTKNTREFLVVWGGFSNSDVFGQRVSPTGALLGNNMTISAGTSIVYDRDPSLAYNPLTDKFLVGWGSFDDGAGNGFASARMVTAGTLTSEADRFGSIWTFDNAAISITSVTYNSSQNRFLFGWYHDGGGSNKAHYGVLLEANGAVVPNGSSDLRVLSAVYAAYDALDIEHNKLSGEYFLITHGKFPFDWEDAGVTIKSDGTAYDNGFRVTFTESSLKGNYFPRVATSTAKKEWLVVTSSGQKSVIGQLLGSTSTGEPEVPTCTFTIGSTAATVAPGPGSGTVALTASASACAWTAAASSSSPWLTLGSAASGTGTTTVTYNFTRNAMQQSRTGTITAGGRTFTVTQRGVGRQLLDFNLDSRQDILLHHRTEGWVATWKLDGLNLLNDGAQYLIPNRVADTRWTIVGSADFTGDGWSDLLWQHTGGRLAIWEMSGVFMQTVTDLPSLPSNWRARGIADMNGDTKPDIIVQNVMSGEVGVWLMNGLNVVDGTLLNPGIVSDTRWKVVGSDDFNGDGHIDLLWQHETGGLALWYMNGVTQTSVEWLNPASIPDTAWKVVALGDLNNDGKPDIIFQHQTSNGLAAWFMNGHTMVDAFLMNPSTVPANWSIVGPR